MILHITSVIKSETVSVQEFSGTALQFFLYFRLKYMEALSEICDKHLTDKFKIGGNITDSKVLDIIRDIAPTFKETMLLCKFRNKLEYCSDYFEEIMTDEGLCFTFNMLNSKELYREGYVAQKKYLTNFHYLHFTSSV